MTRQQGSLTSGPRRRRGGRHPKPPWPHRSTAAGQQARKPEERPPRTAPGRLTAR